MKSFSCQSVAFLYFFVSLLLSTTPVDADKLVIYAGPHKAASTSIESFLYQYASGHSRYGVDGQVLNSAERKKTFGLRYWMWPRITGQVANEIETDQPYKIFGHLVTEHDNALLRDEILEGIRISWDTHGLEGIVLGSEEFDQIGPLATYDAMHALHKIVDFLSVPANDVTMVLNYRSPRLDQWAAMWAHATQTADENFALEYEQWLCDADRMEMHVEVLATQMNPLNAALAFVNEGWNVRFIDLEGVEEAGRDVSHVVACDVMTGRCEDGSVLNHKLDNPHHNSIDVEFSALTEEQRVDAENLFLARDCAYMDELRENVKFGVIYNNSVWSNCDPAKSQVYQKLKDDPTYMYKALLSQITCPNDMPIPKSEMITMTQALNGKSVKTTKSSDKKEKKKKRSAGSILLELFSFIGIMVAAMGYQYHRMIQTDPLPIGAHRVEAVAEDEEDQGPFTSHVDAEYGDTDGDNDDDEIPTGYRD